FQIVRVYRDVPALLVFVALDDLVTLDRTHTRDDQLLADPLAGGLVDLVEPDAVTLARRRIESNADRHQRELQKPGPVRAGRGCHGEGSLNDFLAIPTKMPRKLFRYNGMRDRRPRTD